ncbi:MAG: ABC transporter substrate-binding protein [Candidatus Portiera sp.]|nr:ABC transporter substrate-binding protein [Portiera sp.]
MKYLKLSNILLTSVIVISVALVSCQKFGSDAVSIATGSTGNDIELLRTVLEEYTTETGQAVEITSMPSSTTDIFGQFKIWLNAKTSEIDIYQVDVIWAPQIGNHLVDLTEAVSDVSGDHFSSIIESQTSNGRLVALPFFTDAPALYYRTDLLDKYNENVPETWDEMALIAEYIMDEEHAAGNTELWGFVFQGNSYEGLTCDALEWVKSHGGGQIIEPDGSISINNPDAVRAIEFAADLVGTISPPGVTTYQEEEARGIWQTGNAVFMRNWPYAYGLGNSDDSAVKGKFDVAPLPSGGAGSAATLGGWNLAVSKYSEKQEAAIDVVKYLASKKVQKFMAINNSKLPTLPELYSDPEVLKAVPFFAEWLDVFKQAVPRPSAPTKTAYNEVSKEFWTAVHNVLTGSSSAKDSLANLERKLTDIKESESGW